MKLDIDCMRDIMLEVEKLPFGKELYFRDLQKQLNKYSEDVLSYTCIKLDEAGFIDAYIISADNFTSVQLINDLTYDGHQFLANIRSDNVWKKTKSVLNEIGSTSVSSIFQVAAGIVQTLISNKIGL